MEQKDQYMAWVILGGHAKLVNDHRFDYSKLFFPYFFFYINFDIKI